MALPLGWHTDLAVLRRGGAVVEEHRDHLVVRDRAHPTFHWGHFVLVTAPETVPDPAHWLTRFREVFPDASYRAIGLVAEVSDADWAAEGLSVSRAPVLVGVEPVRPHQLPAGYQTRRLATPRDWEQSTELREAAYPGSADFARRTTRTRAAMSGRGEIFWFGAFAGGDLAAELGIMDCGAGVARYQGVLTHPAHRRRGLTSHLLGVADQYARAALGADRTVIIADEGSTAAQLYRGVGMVDAQPKVQAYLFG